jgi:signal transduction histidine kinase
MSDVGQTAERHSERLTWIDVLVAGATAMAQVGGTELFVRIAGSDRPLDPIAYGLLLAGALPLIVRNRYPLPVLLVVAASATAYMLLGYPGGFYTIALVLAIWAAVAAGHRLASVAIVIALVAIVIVAGFVVPTGHVRDPDAPIWFGGWLVAALVLGEVSRGRRGYLEQVERRAFEAERTREEEALRRAGEERLRIARELHDVLSHHISVINVQAGVAVHLLDKGTRTGAPERDDQMAQTREALVTISESSREAMRELRGILGVLRHVDKTDPRAPAPGLDALDDLVATVGATGLDVSVEAEGERRPLPVGTDLAAYRIIQESLTNVARHAQGQRATVSLRYRPQELEVEVADDGPGVPDGATLVAGNGLTGMRERAAAVGGSLEAGPRPGGGFRVRARLPVQATS